MAYLKNNIIKQCAELKILHPCMCLSIPVKIIKLEKNSVIIKNNHGNLKINSSLIKNPKINDWILVHANLAIKKISKKEAYEIQRYLSK